MMTMASGVPIESAAVLIALGALVAADRPLPLMLVAGAALMCKLLNGCFNSSALA